MGRRSRRPTVAMFGHFGAGNIGNEASLAAGLAEMRASRPDVDLVVVCPRPDVVERDHAVPATAISGGRLFDRIDGCPRGVRLLCGPLTEPLRWLGAIRFLRSVDAVVVPGTGILDDFGTAPHQMPYDLFRWSTAARLARRPWTMVSIGAGPITHPVSRWLMQRTALNATRITYRDESSRSYMSGIGAPSPIDSVTADIVFAVDAPVADTPHDVLNVGFGLMTYFGWRCDPVTGAATFDRYLDIMTDIARRLLADGAVVRLLIGEDGDRVAVERITAALRCEDAPDQDRLVVEPIADFGELLRQVSTTDAVIATRYHNIIAALMVGRPTVAIGYAPKFTDVMDGCGLRDHLHQIDDVTADAVLQSLHVQLSRSADVTRDVSAWRARQRDRVRREFTELVDDVLGGSCPVAEMPMIRRVEPKTASPSHVTTKRSAT